jgi:hypothetical protein
MRDSVVFAPFALVEKVAPTLAVSNGGSIPDGTMIPIQDPTIYNRFDDFIADSNGAFPSIAASTSPAASSNWRMRSSNTHSVPWEYKTALPMYASLGMQLRISLENNTEWGGDTCAATFYCVSEDE